MDSEESYWSEVVGEYLNSKRTGALVVTGEWGSGKTHLYKNTISKIVERSGRKCLYVSLYSYGVSGKGIDDFLIEELSGVKDINDSTKSGAGAMLTALFTGITSDSKNSGVMSAAVMAVGGAVKKRILDAIDGYVLCFDDLDRLSEVNFTKAWSEVNYFSEFKSRKVILLLDETKLPQGSVHTASFEKNIWRDVGLRISTGSALNQSFNMVAGELAEELKGVRESRLLPIVEFFGIKNIRTVATSLESLKRIVLYKVSIGSNHKISFDRLAVLYQVAFFSSLISNIYGRKSDTHKSFIRSICNGYYQRKLNIMMLSRQDSPLSEEDVFIQSLPSFSCSGATNCEFVYDYVLSDKLDVEDLERAIVYDPNGEDLSGRPICDVYARLIDRVDMDESEYLAYFDETLRVLQNPTPGICNVKKLANIMSEFSYDSNMGGTPITLDELSVIFQGALEKWQALVGLEGYSFEGGIEEYIYFNKGNQYIPQLDVMLGALDDAVVNFEREREYLESLEGWEEDRELKTLRKLSEGFSMPLFKYLPIDKLESLLANGSGGTLGRFNYIIRKRFSVSGDVKVILQERESLVKLRSMFEGGTGFGYRRVQFSEGCRTVDAAIAHIDDIASRIKSC
ncbi:P-loop NTPase fold protein [Pseudomonas antarctica]|uniref:P-loop NTPase fold protein n=1 Tax=Pseudomonas antarctica TaxID=219572 RepID=UPI003F754792